MMGDACLSLCCSGSKKEIHVLTHGSLGPEIYIYKTRHQEADQKVSMFSDVFTCFQVPRNLEIWKLGKPT